MIRHHVKDFMVIALLFCMGAGYQGLVNKSIENTVERELRHYDSSELMQYSLAELTELRVK